MTSYAGPWTIVLQRYKIIALKFRILQIILFENNIRSIVYLAFVVLNFVCYGIFTNVKNLILFLLVI